MKASAAIKKALKEKDQGIISGEKAMLGILEELHRQVMAEIGKAALGSWDSFHLRQVLDSIEFQMARSSSAAQTTMTGLLDTAWGMGVATVDAPLAVAGIYTGYHLATSTLDVMKEYSNDYLKNLFGDAWYKVKGEITLGVIGGKSPQEVAAAIGKTMDAGRFKDIATRAETIARHEMGTVYSQAGQMRMEQAAEHVPGLEKQWRHVGHPRAPRPTHAAMDGHHVPIGEPFFHGAGGFPLMYPRQPEAPLEETMHCGCDSIPYHADWQ